MAQTLGELVLKLQLDQAQFQTQLNKIQADVKKTSGNFGVLGTALKALPWAAAAAGIYRVGAAIAKASSDAQETQQKFNVVFSGIQVQATETAKRLSESFRLADQTSKELLSSTANILQSFGFAGEESLKFSERIVNLSADLISFTNNAMGIEGAVSAITKSFLGEAEQLKSLGKIALVEYLQPIAKAQGKNIETMTRQERALFTFNEILKQSKNEVGDYARSWMSPANILRAVQERFKDIKTTLGDNLAPALGELGKAFLSSTENSGSLAAALGLITKGVAYAIIGVANFIRILDVLSLQLQKPDAKKKLDAEIEGYKAIEAVVRQSHARQLKEGENLEAGLERLKKQGDPTAGANLEYLRNHKKGVSDAAAAQQDLYKREQQTIEAISNATKALDNNNKKTVENVGVTREAQIQQQALAKSYEDALKKLNELRAKASGDQIKEIEAKAKEERDVFKKSFGETSALYKEALGYIDKIEKDDIFKKRVETINKYFQAFGDGLVGIFSAIQQLQSATSQATIEALEDEKKARYEAAGVAEDTEVMKAQAELAEAEASGNAVLIGEKKRILEKAKIDEEYQKKKSQIEYQAALDSWGIQIAMTTAQVAMGIMNAFSSGAAIPYAGAAVGAAYAAVAAATGAIQLAAVIAAKPKAPRFEMGGIVPGDLLTGDNVVARLNSREMVLTQQQQANLFNQINSGNNGETTIHNIIQLDGQTLYENLSKATFDGRLLVASRAVV